ncbi:hypothetical protein cyc_01028 [Cyclospora cayetanensis]|nr:hypothetical protein cyc_01028 [Cyclospora cayetanensis]
MKPICSAFEDPVEFVPSTPATGVAVETPACTASTGKVPYAKIAAALSTSRRPLFLTYTLISATDAATLLQLDDPLQLASELEELLQLQAFVTELRGSTAESSTPRPSRTINSCRTSSQKSNTERGFPGDDSADAANTKSNSVPMTSGQDSTVSLDTLDVTGETTNPVIAPTDVPHADIFSQHQLLRSQQHLDEEDHATAYSVVLEYFVAATSFCRLAKFSPQAVSTFLTLLLEVYRQSVQQHMTAAAAFDTYKSLLLKHSIYRPPWATEVFCFQQLMPATEFFFEHFVRLLPQLQQLHARHRPRIGDYSG